MHCRGLLLHAHNAQHDLFPQSLHCHLLIDTVKYRHTIDQRMTTTCHGKRMQNKIIYLLWPTAQTLHLAAAVCRAENDTIHEVIETGQRSLPETIALVSHHKRTLIRIFLPADSARLKNESQHHLQTISRNKSEVSWHEVSDDPPSELIHTYLRYKITLAFFGDASGRLARDQLKDAVISLATNPDRIAEKYSHSLQTFIRLNQPAIEGQTAQMITLKRDIRRVAPSGLKNILILGETGSGKEAVAFFLHDFDPERQPKGFHAINCAGLQEEFLVSELFGHVKGAYTGASKDRKGLISKLDKGTLFLDELPDMPRRVQAMLLRFLESGEYSPMGSSKTYTADVKIIAGGQKTLLIEKINSRQFRKDLYYRLAGKTLHIPSLREISGDIPKIIDHLVYRSKASRTQRDETIAYFNTRLIDLKKYHWPGNIRELANYVKRKLHLGKEEEITLGEDAIFTQFRLEIPKKGEEALPEKDPESEKLYPYAVKPSFYWSEQVPDLQELRQEHLQLATPNEVRNMYCRYIHENLSKKGASQALIAKNLHISVNSLKSYIKT
jgi:DNA-binding NtrC family response regulator